MIYYIYIFMLQYYLNNMLGGSIIIDIIWIITILCAIGVIVSHNAVVSVVFLLGVYVLISIYLYYIGLGIIGLLYLMVYVGAITVLFLFILSLLDLGESELKRASLIPDVLPIIISLFLLVNIFIYSNSFYLLSSDNLGYLILFLISFFNLINYNNSIDNILSNSSNYLLNNDINLGYVTINNWFNINPITEFKIIGELLYTDYSSLFIVLGFTLLLSVIGAIVLLHQLQDSSSAS